MGIFGKLRDKLEMKREEREVARMTHLRKGVKPSDVRKAHKEALKYREERATRMAYQKERVKLARAKGIAKAKEPSMGERIRKGFKEMGKDIGRGFTQGRGGRGMTYDRGVARRMKKVGMKKVTKYVKSGKGYQKKTFYKPVYKKVASKQTSIYQPPSAVPAPTYKPQFTGSGLLPSQEKRRR